MEQYKRDWKKQAFLTTVDNKMFYLQIWLPEVRCQHLPEERLAEPGLPVEVVAVEGGGAAAEVHGALEGTERERWKIRLRARG